MYMAIWCPRQEPRNVRSMHDRIPRTLQSDENSGVYIYKIGKTQQAVKKD